MAGISAAARTSSRVTELGERPTANEGSVASGMNWMGCLTLLLFWLPVVGPLIAGLVGGTKAGSVKRALLAVFVPGVMTGLMVAVGVTYLTDVWFWGLLAGLGGIALSFLNIGPLLLGAVLGGFTAGLSRRWRKRKPTDLRGTSE